MKHILAPIFALVLLFPSDALTQTRQWDFDRALAWGEATLGYDASVAAGGLVIFPDTVDKALKFRALMLEWQYDTDKIETDPMLKAREIVEELKKAGNPKAESRLIMFFNAYRTALANGDATEIANAKTVLAAAMVEAGWVTARQAAQLAFDPEKVLAERRPAAGEQ